MTQFPHPLIFLKSKQKKNQKYNFPFCRIGDHRPSVKIDNTLSSLLLQSWVLLRSKCQEQRGTQMRSPFIISTGISPSRESFGSPPPRKRALLFAEDANPIPLRFVRGDGFFGEANAKNKGERKCVPLCSWHPQRESNP